MGKRFPENEKEYKTARSEKGSLRDIVPQTPFFASRLYKVYSAFSFFAFSSASSTCSASQLVRP